MAKKIPFPELPFPPKRVAPVQRVKPLAIIKPRIVSVPVQEPKVNPPLEPKPEVKSVTPVIEEVEYQHENTVVEELPKVKDMGAYVLEQPEW